VTTTAASRLKRLLDENRIWLHSPQLEEQRATAEKVLLHVTKPASGPPPPKPKRGYKPSPNDLRAAVVAGLQLTLLANFHSARAIQRILDGDEGGWEDADRAYLYLVWDRRVEPRGFIHEAALLYLHARAVGDERHVAWLGERLATSLAEGQPFSLPEHSATAHFAGWLSRRGTGAPACATKGSLGPYRKVIDAWDDADALEAALAEACDHHLKQASSAADFTDFALRLYSVLPIEVHAIVAVRASEQQPTKLPDHPLLAAPFMKRPPRLTVPRRDEWIDRVIQKAVTTGFLTDFDPALDGERGKPSSRSA
jgi:hypothetical protein